VASTEDRSRLAYPAVLGTAVCCYVALGVVLPALPGYVTGHLHAGASAAGLAVGAPAISGVLARPAGGRLADRLGPRAIVIAGAATMSAAAALALGHPELPRLLAARLAVGAGEGAMMGATVAWLLRLSRPDRRGRALGHVGLANYLGLTLGPLIGEVAPGGLETRWLVASVAPTLALALVARLEPLAPAEAAPRTPILVGPVLRPGLGLALANVGYVAVVSLAGLALARRGVAGAAHVVPVYAATVAVLRLVAGSVPDRAGARTTVVGASALGAAGLAVLAVTASAPLAIAATVVTAAGQAMLVPALGLLVLLRAGEQSQGAAAGAFFAFFDIGVGAGGPALGAIADLAGAGTAIGASSLALAAVGPAAGVRASRR
jgi:predicted MFS family arabinose efflux permease